MKLVTSATPQLHHFLFQSSVRQPMARLLTPIRSLCPQPVILLDQGGSHRQAAPMEGGLHQEVEEDRQDHQEAQDEDQEEDPQEDRQAHQEDHPDPESWPISQGSTVAVRSLEIMAHSERHHHH